MEKEHVKKMIAPIIISIILLLYSLVYLIAFLFIDGIALAAKIIFMIIPLCIAIADVYVFVERVKEIRSGEEDDLSKY